MRIGVDVRSLSEPITGIGRYTISLLELMVLENTHQWYLYSHRPILHGNWDIKNVNIRTLSFPKWFKGLYLFWSQFILPFLVKQDGIDLFWSTSHRLPWFLPKSVIKVITVHDLVYKFAPKTMKPFGRFLDMKYLPKNINMSNEVIAVSKSTAKDLILEIPEANSKTNIIYEANTLKRDNFSRVSKIDGEYILFVGTLEPRKNLPRLLKAYSLLSKQIKNDYSLVIVGGKGWGNDNIFSIIKNLEINKNVRVLGYQTDQDLATLYHFAYLLAMPSLYEGFGLPILEAMSFGVPVVTSNISSLPEVVGDTGVLVEPTNLLSIKDGLEKLLTNKRLRDSLSKDAYARSKLFSWNHASKQTLEVFEKAFNSHE